MELRVDGVPVVVAVDQHEVGVADLRQGVEAERAVEDEALAVLRLDLVEVKRRIRRRVDPVHNGIVRGRSPMIRWAARSVIPTASAISRRRISGSAATARSTRA